MIRAMDGVVRAGRRPMVVGSPAIRPVREAGVLDLRAGATRSLDGVVRRTGPSPLDVLNTTYAMPALPVAPAMPAANEAGTGLDWPYAIAFSLLIPAMIAASVVSTVRLNGSAAGGRPAARAATVAQVAETTTQPVQPVVPDNTQLAGILSSFIASHGSQYSVVIKDLGTSETASQGAGASMTSASLYKLFVAKAIYQMIDSGKLDYGSRAGNGQTIASCLNNMITWSDNNCGATLGNLVGWGRHNGQLGTEGFGGTNLATLQKTSAQDVATLFERLHSGTLLSPSSTQNFLDLLKAQRVNNRLPLGLPGGTTFAHKTGDLYGYLHDAGIVYGPKSTYLIVVMGAPGSSAGEFGLLSQQVYAHFNK